MKLPKELTTVTPFSKYLALSLFIILPMLTFFLGMRYQELASQTFFPPQMSITSIAPAAPMTSLVAFSTDNNHAILTNVSGTMVKDLGKEHSYLNEPALSPDTKLVAFVNEKNQLVVVDTTTFQQNVVATQDPATQIIGVNWSPTGKMLAYHLTSEDIVFFMNADGTNKREIRKANCWYSAWSPNGDRLAVFSNPATTGLQGNPVTNVSVYDLTGVQQTKYAVSGAIAGTQTGFDWLTNTTVYFTHGGTRGISALWESDIDGSHARLIAGIPDNQPNFHDPQGGVPWSRSLLISPDNKTVLLCKLPNSDEPALWTMSLDGKTARSIPGLSNITDCQGAWWFSDSKHFIFSTGAYQHPSYYLTDITGTKPVKIYSN